MTQAVVAVMVALVLLVGLLAIGVTSDSVSHSRADDFDQIVEPIFQTTAWVPLAIGAGVIVTFAMVMGATRR